MLTREDFIALYRLLVVIETDTFNDGDTWSRKLLRSSLISADELRDILGRLKENARALDADASHKSRER